MKTYHTRAWKCCVSFAHYACNQLVHSVSYFQKPFHQPCTQESTTNCLFARFLLLDKRYDVTTQMKKPISAISRLARSDSDRTISLVVSQCVLMLLTYRVSPRWRLQARPLSEYNNGRIATNIHDYSRQWEKPQNRLFVILLKRNKKQLVISEKQNTWKHKTCEN